MTSIIKGIGCNGSSTSLEDDGASWVLIDIGSDVIDTVVYDDPAVVGLVVAGHLFVCHCLVCHEGVEGEIIIMGNVEGINIRVGITMIQFENVLNKPSHFITLINTLIFSNLLIIIFSLK